MWMISQLQWRIRRWSCHWPACAPCQDLPHGCRSCPINLCGGSGCYNRLWCAHFPCHLRCGLESHTLSHPSVSPNHKIPWCVSWSQTKTRFSPACASWSSLGLTRFMLWIRSSKCRLKMQLIRLPLVKPFYDQFNLYFLYGYIRP
jgi:hypothetical protein